jgi:amidohydrolase
MNITSLINQKAQELLPEITKIRRDLHQHPELSFKEFRTSKIISEYLYGLGLKVQTGIAQTGVVALLEGKKSDRTLAIRADMDALAIDEESSHNFKSLNSGAAHACGHDGHMANALGVAKVLSQLTDYLTGNVKFIFQPAEEVFPPGGASEMVKEGVLNNPDVDGIVMLHMDPTIPLGSISVKYGMVTGTSDEFRIEIIGRGGHGATPQLTVDPIIISCHVILALQTIISRNVDPLQPSVISIGSIHAGHVFNAIPENIIISGTVRTVDLNVRKLISSRMKKIAMGISKSMGAQCKFSFIDNCPATTNSDKMVDAVIKAAKKTIGEENIIVHNNIQLWTEDFCCYSDRVPGVYFSLGTASNNPKKDFSLHHPQFNFDESALINGIKVMSQMAIDFFQ